MEGPSQSSLDDIELIATTQNIDMDMVNEDGWTPLMIACGRGKIEMVKCFLDQGADPNFRSTKDGNTPMHCASVGYHCKQIPSGRNDHFHSKDSMQPRIEILRLLIKHGATLTNNSNGFSPLSLAAIYYCFDTVEFFVQEDVSHQLQLSNAEKARAYELLGVALGLNIDSRIFCSESFQDPCRHFWRALSIYEEDGNTSFRDHELSEIATSFSLFSIMNEYKTEEDFEKNINDPTRSVEIQCFLVAERVLPEEIKTRYLLPRLLKHGLDGVFNSGMNAVCLSQGSQILREVVQWELESKLELGSVLVGLLNGIHSVELRFDDDTIKACYDLLDLCLQVLNEVSQDCLYEVNTFLVDELGRFLYDLALYNFIKSTEMFESLLQFGERMVRILQRRSSEKRCASIIHYILRMNIINEVFWKSSKNRELLEVKRFQRMRENRVKRLILRMLMCEDATQIDDDGDSMLHSLLNDTRFTKKQFTRETALILIRNGCDIEARNTYGETVRDMICKSISFDPNAPENEELMTLITPLTSVLPLQEIAARTILRDKIPHEGIVPRHLSAFVRGNLEPDSELFPQYYPSELSDVSSSSYHESYSSSSDGTISDQYDVSDLEANNSSKQERYPDVHAKCYDTTEKVLDLL